MLTPRREKFIQELVKGKSKRDAYRSSFNTAKMKPSTIDKRVADLLKNGEVRGRYDELLKKAESKAEEDSIEMRRKIIDEWRAIAFADIRTYYNFTPKGRGRAKEIEITIKDLTNLDTRAIQEIGYDTKGRPKLKLYDRQKALEQLALLYGVIAAETGDTGLRLELAEGTEEFEQ